MIVGWEMKTIADCCDILDNKRIPLNAEQRAMILGDIPYYGANGVQGYINKYIFDEDLILIAEDGGNFEQFASRPIAYTVSGKCWVNNHAHILKAKQGYNQDFIFYSIVNRNILYYIQGGTRSKLNQSDLKSIEFQIPRSTEEQTLIASILRLVDNAYSKTELLIAKYDCIKRGLMKDLLSHGIDDSGIIRSEKSHKYKDSPIGRIPKEWDVEKLGNIADFVSGKAWSTKSLTEHGKKIIRISNLHKPDFPYWRYSGPYTEDMIVNPGDILFSWAGVANSIDCVQYLGEPALLNQHIYNLRFSNDSVKKFAYIYLNWFLPSLRKEIEGGAGQLHLTKDKIQSICIPMPNQGELNRIVQKLESLDSLISLENDLLSKLASKKRGLMQDLLTGKVRIDTLLKEPIESI
jgi:type I restriction enzyme S subunit